MTGPEHYRTAEHWLRLAKSGGDGEHAPDGEETEEATLCAAIAQAHATLALAAGAAPVAALDAAQLKTVLNALDDAAGYRQLRGPASCADCRKADPARCDDHSRDADLTRRYDALARQLRQEAR